MGESQKSTLLPKIMIIGLLFVPLVYVHGCFAEGAEERLFAAAGQGDTATVERLVNEGVDVDGKDLEWHPSATPLTNAAAGGHIETVKFLINHHADAKGALHMAMENDRSDIVRVLKAAGAKE